LLIAMFCSWTQFLQQVVFFFIFTMWFVDHRQQQQNWKQDLIGSVFMSLLNVPECVWLQMFVYTNEIQSIASSWARIVVRSHKLFEVVFVFIPLLESWQRAWGSGHGAPFLAIWQATLLYKPLHCWCKKEFQSHTSSF
jgi:hypothetical protein